MASAWRFADPKPQDKVRLRCDKTSDDNLFKVGTIYDGFWSRFTNDEGQEKIGKGLHPIDEHGESYGTYREPWFRFTIVEGLTEPPKE